jgi:hypothetical protein
MVGWSGRLLSDWVAEAGGDDAAQLLGKEGGVGPCDAIRTATMGGEVARQVRGQARSLAVGLCVLAHSFHRASGALVGPHRPFQILNAGDVFSAAAAAWTVYYLFRF